MYDNKKCCVFGCGKKCLQPRRSYVVGITRPSTHALTFCPRGLCLWVAKGWSLSNIARLGRPEIYIHHNREYNVPH